MQLKRRPLKGKPRHPTGEMGPLSASLATATCALLGTASPGAAVAQDIGEWQIDTAGFYYGEADGRVQDLSLNVLARTQISEDKFLDLTLGIDSLTGASPNGAAPSASPQVFPRPISITRTSGGGTQTSGGNWLVPAGELPLDSSFQDKRFAGSASWQQPLGQLSTVNFGGSISSEYDYKHFGLDTRIARDFNNRNTTLSAGVAWANDTVEPVGGIPIAFSALTGRESPGGVESDSDEGQYNEGSKPKDVVDLLLGVTQVIGRHTIGQVNYSMSRSDGYLTDPYKILSVVDGVSGDVMPGPDPGTGLYLYESRPDYREKRSLYGMIKHDFGGNVMDVSYRAMSDDWGIESKTMDLHYRWNFGGGRFIQPHIRLYSQTAADFYHTVLFDGEPLPSFATADYRLGKFDAMTVGFKYGQPTQSGEFSTRLELYRQSSSPSPEALVGSLQSVDLTPDLTAVLAEISYRFKS
jgi:hypothetical protein